MTYRKEIDGLRGISVMSVVFAHAGFVLPKAGFIGVDIFFVISGYLISSLIIADLDRDRFSIKTFYERRARRLLPALVVMMLFCLPFAWASMMPSQFLDFLKSALAAAFFCSNLLFWRSAGYFDTASWLKPLLHTWSLGVEEQFYILFPLAMIFLWRFGRRLAFATIVVLALCSLVACEWAWRHAPVANYYLVVSRAWELLAGSICAFVLHRANVKNSDILSLSGLGMIFFSMLYFDATTPFPSVYALVPALGTALILVFAGTTTWTRRLLSAPALTNLGLMSYSLYLWHQPVFAFARIYSVGTPSQTSMAGLIALSVASAWVSWRFVERPFRHMGLGVQPSRKKAFVIALAFASMATFVVSVTKSFAVGSNSKLFAMLDYPIHRAPYEDCSDPGLTRAYVDMCKLNTKVKADAVLVGDSHAEDKLHGLYTEDPQRNWIVVASSGCAPFFNVYVGISQRDCDRKAKATLDYVAANQSIKTVAISFLSSYASAALYAADHIDGLRLPFEATAPKYLQASRENIFFIGLFETIKILLAQNKTVIFLADQPELPFFPGECLKGQIDCVLSEKVVLRRQAAYRHIINKLGTIFPSLQIYDPISFFCKRGKCRYRTDDVIYYRDSNHLTLAGSTSYARDFLSWEKTQRATGEQVADQVSTDAR